MHLFDERIFPFEVFIFANSYCKRSSTRYCKSPDSAPLVLKKSGKRKEHIASTIQLRMAHKAIYIAILSSLLEAKKSISFHSSSRFYRLPFRLVLSAPRWKSIYITLSSTQFEVWTCRADIFWEWGTKIQRNVLAAGPYIIGNRKFSRFNSDLTLTLYSYRWSEKQTYPIVYPFFFYFPRTVNWRRWRWRWCRAFICCVEICWIVGQNYINRAFPFHPKQFDFEEANRRQYFLRKKLIIFPLKPALELPGYWLQDIIHFYKTICNEVCSYVCILSACPQCCSISDNVCML